MKNIENIIEEKLPELDSNGMKVSVAERSMSWARDILDNATIGQLIDTTEIGFQLQLSSRTTLRCIWVYDHPPALNMLHITKRIINNVGGILELEPYTILIPESEVAFESSDSENIEVFGETENSMEPNGKTKPVDEYNFAMEVA
jgi:hypothetical protein